MHRFDRSFVFVVMPMIANIILAIAAFSVSPKDFFVVSTCHITVVTALMGSLVTFIGFRLHDLGPKRVVLSLLIQSATLIFIFAGIYRGHGLLYGGGYVSLLEDWQSPLYFSVVTWTTLGYGDFSPPPELRLITAIQALLGYGFFGISVGLGTAILCEKSESRASGRSGR